MDAVVIGTPSDHLRLSLEPDDPAHDYLVVQLSAEGLSATQRVYSHYASGWRNLAAFFAELAADWRGWSGTREWASVESDLKIAARHEFGHVQLHVSLRSVKSGWGDRGWTVPAELTLEAGEQLRRVAAAIADLPILST